MNKHGFTLTEILTAVIIVTILTVMAMPLYEKTIERSRLAEARTLMNRLQEAKLAAMDNTGCEVYSYESNSAGCPHLEHLRVAFIDEGKAGKPAASGKTFQTKYFTYSLLPTSPNAFVNGICARRDGGDYNGTMFAYLREEGGEGNFKCKNPSNCTDCCEAYGLGSDSELGCSF